MKILIGPWGNPKVWKEVDYEFKDRTVKSKTSIKILQECLKPDKTIIIGLETLASEDTSYEDVITSSRQQYEECLDEFTLEVPMILSLPLE